MTISADLVFVNGTVRTLDPYLPRTDTAVRNGRIVGLGRAETDELVDARTEMVDLNGGTLIPGFQDVHIHAVHGGLELAKCDLTGSSAGDGPRRPGRARLRRTTSARSRPGGARGRPARSGGRTRRRRPVLRSRSRTRPPVRRSPTGPAGCPSAAADGRCAVAAGSTPGERERSARCARRGHPAGPLRLRTR